MPQYGTVQNIEISPHQPGKAYIAVHRYRLDDWKPYVWKTTNYGKSWKRIADGTSGIPDDFPAWVVREDPEREGLLYAGTEFGLFVSFDDGISWQSFQKNLPVTRIPDMEVHDNDLVVATHGRSFWIMDNLSPLRQINEQVEKTDVHLYSPEAAYRINPAGGGDAESRRPEGRRGGAAFDYIFNEIPDTTVTLEILDKDGDIVRTFTSDSTQAQKDDEAVLPVKKGHNRFYWDLLSDGVDTIGETLFWETSTTEGVTALPGEYQVKLRKAGEPGQTRTFEVKMDPRVEDADMEALKIRHDLAYELQDSLNSIYDALRIIQSVREQVKSIAAHAKEAGHRDKEIQSLSETIVSQLSGIEKELMQVKNESHQDPLNFPPRLKSQYAFLYGYVNGTSDMFRGPVPPTDVVNERLNELNREWKDIRARLEHTINNELARFNQQVGAMGDAVFIPKEY
jgi:hypothetical protein